MPSRLAVLVALVISCAPAAGAGAQVGGPILPPVPHRDIGYFELLGPGGLYSINYERRRTPELVQRFGATSFGVTNLDNVRHEATALLAGGAYLIDVSRTPGFGGGSGKYVELGSVLVAGTFKHQRYSTVEHEGAFLAISPSAGLRSDPPGGGFLFRLTVTPILGLAGGAGTALDGRSELSAGISVGYVF